MSVLENFSLKRILFRAQVVLLHDYRDLSTLERNSISKSGKMGIVLSTDREHRQREQELRRRRIEDDERKHQQELEKLEKDRQAQEQKLKIEREREHEQAMLKIKEQEMRLQKENEMKLAEYQNMQEVKMLDNLEEDNKRKDDLNKAKSANENELLTSTRDRMFNILDATFAKVQSVDMNQATMAACVLQSIKAGAPLDKDVLKEVMSKVAPSPSPEDVVHQILDEVRKDEERFADNSSHVIVERDANRSSNPF